MPLFERDRYQRLPLDISSAGAPAGGGGRRPPPSSSSSCATATILLFVGLCLVGAWLMASSTGGSNAPAVSPQTKSAAQDVDDDHSAAGLTAADGSGGGAAGTKEDAPPGTGRKAPPNGTAETAGSGQDGKEEEKKKDGPAPETETKEEDTPAYAEDAGAGAGDEGGGAAGKNQTAFNDQNGSLDGDQDASRNQTLGGGGQPGGADAPKNETFAVVYGGDNGTTEAIVFEAADPAPTNSSSSSAGASDDNSVPVVVVEDGDGADGDGGEAVAELLPTGQAELLNSTSPATMAQDDNAGGEETVVAELLPSGQAELLNETSPATAQDNNDNNNGNYTSLSSFPTQSDESASPTSKKKNNKSPSPNNNNTPNNATIGETSTEESSYTFKLCKYNDTTTGTGADYIPCLDNAAAIKSLKSTKHYEHRERHCPSPAPSCLVPLPQGYRRPIPWPQSRDQIWLANVPHTKLASYKGNQNWVKLSADGQHLVFPGGGTQFTNGAAHYLDVIAEAAMAAVLWGNRTRVVLDVGCGVASFGGYLFDRDALTMSFAPKDEHEAQVQFALERGIPAVSAVMGTKRLPFPAWAFDLVHCARCRVPWHAEGGRLLVEADRVLRPGGLFVWSATPVYRKDEENVGIWKAMEKLTKDMCWEMVNRTSDALDQTALVVFKKPENNECYGKRNSSSSSPPLCDGSDDPNAVWNVTLQTCMHRVATDPGERGARWPAQWPERLTTAPYWLNESQVGVYGKPAPEDFAADTAHWKKAVNGSYRAGMGIDWGNVRNVIDARSVYGGFAAALRDMKVWVMNIVPVEAPDTLPIIYERGLFGMYHDWCESLSTYPRSYDLVHADHLFSSIKYRCKLRPVMAEVDRILRPEGKVIVREDRETAEDVERIAKTLHWKVGMAVSKEGERLLCFEKTMWRPTQVES